MIMMSLRATWARCAGVAVVVSSTVLLAACSSSGSSVSGSDGGSSSNGNGSSAAGLAAAKAAVAQLTQRPTELNVTEKVGKPVPKGKTVDFISCGATECNQEGAMIKRSTDALGWTLKVINTDGTPESARNAFQQVVRDKPDGVIYVAVDRSTYADLIPQLQANGTFLASACGKDPAGNGIDFANCTPEQQGPVGGAMANWVIADSNGKASALWVNVPAFPTLPVMGDQFKATFSKNCPSCTVDNLDIPVTSLGKDVPDRLVSYLRSHPKVKYLGLGLDSMAIGLPAALKAAGLNDIKLIGEGAGPINFQYIAGGQEAASDAFPYYETFLGCLDAIVRHEAGVPQVASKLPRIWLLTKNNVVQTQELLPVVADAQSKFHELWGVSGS